MSYRTSQEKFPQHSNLVKCPKVITLFTGFHLDVKVDNTLWKLCAASPNYHFVFREGKGGRERWTGRKGEKKREY